MPKTMFKTCQDIMKEIKAGGYSEKISWADLSQIICRIGGSSDLTLKRYRKELLMFGFLEAESTHIFKIKKIE